MICPFDASFRDEGALVIAMNAPMTKEELLDLLNSSPAVTYVLRSDSDFIHMSWISQNVQHVFGFEPEAALSPTWWLENVHPDDLLVLENQLRRESFHQGRRSVNEYRFRHADGHYVWIRDERNIFATEEGGFKKAVGTLIDITDQRQAATMLKRAEEQHAVSELKFRHILNQLPDYVYVLDNDGRFLLANAALCTAMQVTEEALLGVSAFDFFPSGSARMLKQDMLRIFETGELLQSEVVIPPQKDGPYPHGELRLLSTRFPYRGPDGQRLGLVVMASDVSETRRMEVELRHAQKLESVGRLASGVAHEINTPIQFVGDSAYFLESAFQDRQAVVRLYQELRDAVANGADPAPLVEAIRQAEEEVDADYLQAQIPKALARIQDGVGRVATIVRAMKEFAYPDRQEKNPADLNKALLSTITVARNELKHTATVQTDFGELPQVLCRVGDLNQVFLNLLVNAAHAIEDRLAAAPEGPEGLIAVRTRCEDGWVRVSIQDNGMGIPDEIRERIFEPFFTSKEVGRGTGQGLSIARSIVVDKHGGALDFETEPGAGTTFIISLPIEASGEAA